MTNIFLHDQITTLNNQIDMLCRGIEKLEIAGRDPRALLHEYSFLLKQRAQLQKQLDSDANNQELPSGFCLIGNVLKEVCHV